MIAVAVRLPAKHYAANWPAITECSVSKTNELGIRFARLPDGQDKEEAFLDIAQSFHPYLMNYLEMILRGRMPVWGANAKSSSPNREAMKFVQFFVKKGTAPSKMAIQQVCSKFHLAFRHGVAGGRLDPEEIYEILISLLLRVATQYDPDYSNKIAQIVSLLSDTPLGSVPRLNEHEQLKSATLFTAGEIRRYLDFDCDRHCGMLCRRGFLIDAGKQEGAGLRYRKNPEAWPPPASFLNSGPVGFTYYLSKWFRYSLQQYVTSAMSELEAREGIYSLEGYLETRCRLHRPANNEDLSLYDPGRPHDSDLGRDC